MANKRCFCTHLPSKQAVASSNLVSRFFLLTVSLQALRKPVQGNQAMIEAARDGFVFGRKVYTDTLPTILVHILPSQVCIASAESSCVGPPCCFSPGCQYRCNKDASALMPSGETRSHMVYSRHKDEVDEAAEGDLSHRITGRLAKRRHTWKTV